MHSTPRPIGKFIKHNLLLLAFIVALFFLNFYSKTLFYRPGSIHQWRQADCLSIAKNYYEEGMNFFQPKIHFQGPKDGRAVSECPILNYTAAALWKVFGEHEFIYRLLEYLIYIVASFVMFNTILRFFRSALLSLLVVGIFLTSPLLSYYCLNFIADVPALSLCVISFCLFFNFYQTQRQYLFYVSLVTGTLAILMKASALTGISVLVFFTIVDLLRLNTVFGTRALFKRRWGPALALIVAVGMIISWYSFALDYNNNNPNNIFLLTVLPIWEMDEGQVIYNLKMLFNNLFPLFLNKPMFFLFMILVLFVITGFRRLDNFFKYSFIFTFAFFIFYLLFFFQVFGVHDYYLVNLMIFPVVTMMAAVSLISHTSLIIHNTGALTAFVTVILVFNAFHAAAIYRLRTIEDDKMVYWFPFISEDEQKLAKYNFWFYGNNIKKLEHFEPHLRKAGVKRTDFVLSIPDGSFDISLYMIDQKGFTIAQDHIMNDSTVLDRFIPKVRYVIFSDTALKGTRAFQRVSHHFETFLTKGPVQVLRVKASL
jgi:4-amino-4-deoxy-L-arabinose transferase-like glycosyltransferase